MLNKEEVEYNVKSLVSAWLFEAKDLSDLRLVFTGKNKEETIPCTVDTASKELTKVLYNNSSAYKLAKLIGKTKNSEKLFGELDIN